MSQDAFEQRSIRANKTVFIVSLLTDPKLRLVRRHMFHKSNQPPLVLIRRTLWSCGLLLLAAVIVQAQETGGALIGGAGIFRPKNPEAKRTTNPTRPRPRPNNNSAARPDPAEIEEKFQNALSDGNDARDERKYSVAETFYREALKVKPNDTRAFQGLGNVFIDQQRWEDAETAYRKAVESAPTDPDALVALSYVLVQPRTGGLNARRFTD